MASIRDTYQVQFSKEIGRGATGRVFTGTRKVDNKQAAVKMVAKAALSKDLLRSISCEIQSLRELNHPHIVKLYDMFEDPNNFYICMELIHGGELFDRITKKTYYSENDAKEICRIILSAIKHCHDKQIVHRDLKPENLLMAKENDDADVKLVDFGFAEHCTDGKSLSGQMGTPMYMAPEIWENQKYGKPVDLWAFGVITYILLAGYPPFSDDNRARLVGKITKAQFVFHEQYWGEVSAEAKDFITKLLVVDPNARLNVDQALAHRWLVTSDPKHRDLLPSLEQLKEFNAKRRLKGAVQAVLALRRLKGLFGGAVASASANAGANAPAEDAEENVAKLGAIVKKYSGRM